MLQSLPSVSIKLCKAHYMLCVGPSSCLYSIPKDFGSVEKIQMEILFGTFVEKSSLAFNMRMNSPLTAGITTNLRTP